jgi:hypothetical protein
MNASWTLINIELAFPVMRLLVRMDAIGSTGAMPLPMPVSLPLPTVKATARSIFNYRTTRGAASTCCSSKDQPRCLEYVCKKVVFRRALTPPFSGLHAIGGCQNAMKKKKTVVD